MTFGPCNRRDIDRGLCEAIRAAIAMKFAFLILPYSYARSWSSSALM